MHIQHTNTTDDDLQKHHTPSPSEIVQRFKFHRRSRKEGELIASYVPELRLLAGYCTEEAVGRVEINI